MKYLKYVLALVGALAAVVLVLATLGKVKLPVINVKTNFRRIDAEAKAKRLERELGKERALAAIEEEYKIEIAALDAEEEREHEALRHDLGKLAKLLAGKSVNRG